MKPMNRAFVSYFYNILLLCSICSNHFQSCNRHKPQTVYAQRLHSYNIISTIKRNKLFIGKLKMKEKK